MGFLVTRKWGRPRQFIHLELSLTKILAWISMTGSLNLLDLQLLSNFKSVEL